ncbi:MAG: hypothetical protein JXR41_07155, partial [Bacteroidales bacterium]|nr:hypothetical protein [Bacteroidales bacterium]
MKKFFFCIIPVCLLSSLYSTINAQRRSATIEVNPEYTNWAGQKKVMYTDEGHALGEIPLPVKINVELPVSLKTQFIQREAAPASFDLRNTGNITSVKNQGDCGSCWTFATMAAVESRWLTDGSGSYDLSEDNLNTCHPPFVWAPCDGGNTFISSAYLMRGSGPLSEADDPYSDSHTSVDCPAGFFPQGLVTSAWFLPTSDAELIKNYIMQYGALATNMYYTSSSYNSADYTYYYSGTAGTTNHGVTLAGWDDSKVTAGGTGAWIIKNSWGTTWGDNGYFYIAYQDVEVNSTVTAFQNYTDYIADSEVSTYSESGWSGYMFGYGSNSADALVKFIADGDVLLTRVGTVAGIPGAIVTIDIYDNFDGSSSLTGLLGSIPAQTCTYTGYHSFELSAPVNIADGNDYYIRV